MTLKWLPLLIAPALLAFACGGDGSSPTPSLTPSQSPKVGWRETGVYLEVNYWKRNQHFLRRSGQSEA